jgi:hypothetical protein
MKVGPLFEIISTGRSNWEKIIFSRKEITCSSCACLRGTASIYFVEYYMIVRIKI